MADDSNSGATDGKGDVWDADRIRRLAPWAQPVPGVARMTLEDFIAWRREHAGDGWRYELVDGWLIRSPAPTGAAAQIARRLAETLIAAAQPGDQIVLAPDLLDSIPKSTGGSPSTSATVEGEDERTEGSDD